MDAVAVGAKLARTGAAGKYSIVPFMAKVTAWVSRWRRGVVSVVNVKVGLKRKTRTLILLDTTELSRGFSWTM
jgi:hypothetical protein